MPESTADKLLAIDKVKQSMTNHTPGGQVANSIEEMRSQFRMTAWAIIQFSEPSRERSLAITKLEESLMWAVKGLVLQEAGK